MIRHWMENWENKYIILIIYICILLKHELIFLKKIVYIMLKNPTSNMSAIEKQTKEFYPNFIHV